MRKLLIVLALLSALAFLFFMLLPLGDRGMSWPEAMGGIIPAFLVFAGCAWGSTAILPSLVREAPSMAPSWKRRQRSRLLLGCAVVLGLVGLVVLIRTYGQLEQDLALAFDEQHRTPYSGFSLGEAYAKSDRVGIMLGWASAALALVSGVAGLLVRRKH